MLCSKVTSYRKRCREQSRLFPTYFVKTECWAPEVFETSANKKIVSFASLDCLKLKKRNTCRLACVFMVY